MFHDFRTVIENYFDQETAEKIAPQSILRLDLVNCASLITIAQWRPERMSAAAVISLRTVDRHVMPNNILCLQSLICFTSGAYILVHIENG